MKKTSKISVLKKMITAEEQKIEQEGVRHAEEIKALKDKYNLEIMMR